MLASPQPPLPYRASLAFPALSFKHPLFVTCEPGSDRVLVVEQKAKIYAFENRAGVTSTDLFCEIPDHDAYSICFHARYLENGQVFVFSNGPNSEKLKKKNRIVRYTVTKEAPRRVDPDTRHLVIEYESNGHNGGEMAFGPDGYLYISSGDGTSDSDGDVTGQDISDLVSGVLRIDPERNDPERKNTEGKKGAVGHYFVPRDNPFLHIPDARPELWAYGFRNPWRLTFDRKTGDQWVGDIGQDLWEMVHVVQRGNNFGWSVREGNHPFHALRTPGPTPISPPTIEHPHSEARSITGGIVYYGDRFPDLKGAYLYGDYSTGKIWGARYAGGKITWHKELADTSLQILAFAEDAAGRVYIADYTGQIYQLEPKPAVTQTAPFPQRLSETGLFTSVAEYRTHPALVPYEVNSPLWSDGAAKQRHIALPGRSSMEYAER
ncbi:MAG: PQQ-dependent sugar dehydrogenase, partial [Pirellulales bacterium]